MHLLIKQSNSSVKKARETIKNVFIELPGKPVGDLIKKINPIIRGIGNYWSSQVAKKIFEKLHSYIWIKTRRHLKGLHRNKLFKWIYRKYFKPDYTGVSKDNGY
jgi:RNA-directed DNA polymerase